MAFLFPAAKVAASLPFFKHRSYSVTKMTAAFPFSFSLRFQTKWVFREFR